MQNSHVIKFKTFSGLKTLEKLGIDEKPPTYIILDMKDHFKLFL